MRRTPEPVRDEGNHGLLFNVSLCIRKEGPPKETHGQYDRDLPGLDRENSEQ